MIHEILSQLKIIETRLDDAMSQNIPDYQKEEELKIINEKLDELNLRINNHQ